MGTVAEQNLASNVPRPEFMAILGLLPPYNMDDIEKAYLAKVKEAHPDRGGSQQEFLAVQSAYAQAKQYVNFRGDRRGWIAKQIDSYVSVQETIERLEQWGANVEVEAVDWLKKSFGDFAQLTESIVGIRLNDAPNGDEVVDYMIQQHKQLLELRRLDLSGSTVSDHAVRQLANFRRLAVVDLSRTPITWEALQVVESLPELETLRVDGTRLNWLTRFRLSRRLRRKRQAAETARTLHPTNVR